jgi:hypothetical protein
LQSTAIVTNATPMEFAHNASIIARIWWPTS